jgi:hypothetical protein
MDAYTDILGATNNATGNLDEGFKIVSDTAKFKVGVAMNELNLTLMEMGEKALPVVVEAARLLSSMIEDLDQTIGVLGGDVDDTNAILDKSSDQWMDWAGVQQSAMATGITLGREFGGVISSIFGSGGEVDSALTQLQNSWATTDAAIAEGAATQLTLETSAHGAAAGERDLASAVDTLAASVMGANSEMQAMASGFADIAGQRTQEQAAIDLQINALEQELNAAEQATIGQESYGGAVESSTSAIDAQIAALEQQAAALVPQALLDEVIALEAQATALDLVTAEIEGQILEKQKMIDAHEEEVDAIQDEIDALGDLLDEHEKTIKSLDEQIKKEKELAAERKGILPHELNLKKLELEKAKLLQKARGNLDNLTKAERARLAAIDREIAVERDNIKVKELEADVTELQAEAKGEHIKKLEEEKAAIEAEMEAIQDQIDAKQESIDLLNPPELLDEIEALKEHKAQIEADSAQVRNLKEQRELYIKTLVPPELQQEINKLRETRNLMTSLKNQTGGAAWKTDNLTTSLGKQIKKLELERTAIDLVKEGWRLQGEVIAGLPGLPDILGQLKQYKVLLLLNFQKELMAALEAGDFAKVNKLAGWIATLQTMTFAQHGFHGDVSRPTLFMAGEAGRERVDITPGGGGISRGGNTFQFIFQGPVLGDHRQAMQFVEFIRPELERALT